jgi:hypothetical protein
MYSSEVFGCTSPRQARNTARPVHAEKKKKKKSTSAGQGMMNAATGLALQLILRPILSSSQEPDWSFLNVPGEENPRTPQRSPKGRC